MESLFRTDSGIRLANLDQVSMDAEPGKTSEVTIDRFIVA